MDFLPKERLGIFLIVVSFWYLINAKIFDMLHPILAIPGSLIFIAGLWLLLSPQTLTTRTSTYTPEDTPVQPTTEPPTKTVKKSERKTARKSKSKSSINATRPSEK